MKQATQRKQRSAHVPALLNFSSALVMLAEEAPRNLTLSQVSFFLAAAMADRAGRPATFTELRDAVGPTVSRTLHSTYKVFLSEGRIRDGKRAEGMGWLKRDTDPKDNRRKYLRLTKLGQSVIDGLVDAIDQ